MVHKVSFSCPTCRARIKAPKELLGKRRKCPGCGHALIVFDPAAEIEQAGPILPPDVGPILIADSETIDMLLEQAEEKPDPAKRLEELEAENARLKRLLAEFATLVGQPSPAAAPRPS